MRRQTDRSVQCGDTHYEEGDLRLAPVSNRLVYAVGWGFASGLQPSRFPRKWMRWTKSWPSSHAWEEVRAVEDRWDAYLWKLGGLLGDVCRKWEHTRGTHLSWTRKAGGENVRVILPNYTWMAEVKQEDIDDFADHLELFADQFEAAMDNYRPHRYWPMVWIIISDLILLNSVALTSLWLVLSFKRLKGLLIRPVFRESRYQATAPVRPTPAWRRVPANKHLLMVGGWVVLLAPCSARIIEKNHLPGPGFMSRALPWLTLLAATALAIAIFRAVWAKLHAKDLFFLSSYLGAKAEVDPDKQWMLCSVEPQRADRVDHALSLHGADPILEIDVRGDGVAQIRIGPGVDADLLEVMIIGNSRSEQYSNHFTLELQNQYGEPDRRKRKLVRKDGPPYHPLPEGSQLVMREVDGRQVLDHVEIGLAPIRSAGDGAEGSNSPLDLTKERNVLVRLRMQTSETEHMYAPFKPTRNKPLPHLTVNPNGEWVEVSAAAPLIILASRWDPHVLKGRTVRHVAEHRPPDHHGFRVRRVERQEVRKLRRKEVQKLRRQRERARQEPPS